MRSRTEHRGRIFRTVYSEAERRFVSIEEVHPFVAQLADRQEASSRATEPAIRPQDVIDTAGKGHRK